MEQSIFFSFFGGVSQDGTSWMIDFDKVLLELAKWLLPIGVCLLAEGICLEEWRKIESLSCYRYEKVKIWWRKKFVKSLLNGLAVAAVLLILAIAVDILGAVRSSGQSWKEVWKVLILWFVHLVTILSLFVVLDLTKLRRLAPAILLLFEGFTFLVGFQSMGISRFMYGMWGMYFQSEWNFGETGVSVSISLMTEGALLAISYLIGRFILGRAILSEQR